MGSIVGYWEGRRVGLSKSGRRQCKSQEDGRSYAVSKDLIEVLQDDKDEPIHTLKEQVEQEMEEIKQEKEKVEELEEYVHI